MTWRVPALRTGWLLATRIVSCFEQPVLIVKWGCVSQTCSSNLNSFLLKYGYALQTLRLSLSPLIWNRVECVILIWNCLTLQSHLSVLGLSRQIVTELCKAPSSLSPPHRCLGSAARLCWWLGKVWRVRWGSHTLFHSQSTRRTWQGNIFTCFLQCNIGSIYVAAVFHAHIPHDWIRTHK